MRANPPPPHPRWKRASYAGCGAIKFSDPRLLSSFFAKSDAQSCLFLSLFFSFFFSLPKRNSWLRGNICRSWRMRILQVKTCVQGFSNFRELRFTIRRYWEYWNIDMYENACFISEDWKSVVKHMARKVFQKLGCLSCHFSARLSLFFSQCFIRFSMRLDATLETTRVRFRDGWRVDTECGAVIFIARRDGDQSRRIGFVFLERCPGERCIPFIHIRRITTLGISRDSYLHQLYLYIYIATKKEWNNRKIKSIFKIYFFVQSLDIVTIKNACLCSRVNYANLYYAIPAQISAICLKIFHYIYARHC